VKFRRFFLPFVAVVACLGQANWQAVTNPAGVDFTGLSPAKKQMALRIMQTEKCACGCDMAVEECRVKDPSCGTSKKLANLIAKEAGEGKTEAQIRADVQKAASEPPPMLDDAVKISTTGDPVTGPTNARITVVEFSDFQCPYCSQAVAEIKEVLRQRKDVKLIFKQFPLDSHADAQFGAEAALAAQAQGKFWEMHDMLYAGFPNLARARVLGYARTLNLDLKRFTTELDSHKYRSRVLAEREEGENAGVEGTPTFYFNGRRYNGPFEAKEILAMLNKEFK
jgi:protein-disulfide isomerase